MSNDPPARKKRGPKPRPKSTTVKVAVSPELHAQLGRLIGFGWGTNEADVLRALAVVEVRRLQDAARLPDAALPALPPAANGPSKPG